LGVAQLYSSIIMPPAGVDQGSAEYNAGAITASPMDFPLLICCYSCSGSP
jgi:hypothetical protein